MLARDIEIDAYQPQRNEKEVTNFTTLPFLASSMEFFLDPAGDMKV